MDSIPELSEVNHLNTSMLSDLTDNVIVKEEVKSDQNLNNETDDYDDDFEYETFHQAYFRDISTFFDNDANIGIIDDACEKLKNCFIENSILTVGGESKLSLETPHSPCFLKHRDVDDAFMDMVVDSNVNKMKDKKFKKINLNSFKENIFPLNNELEPLSDNESQTKNDETDSEGIDDSSNFTEDLQSGHEIMLNVDAFNENFLTDTDFAKNICSDSNDSQAENPVVDPLAGTDSADNEAYLNIENKSISPMREIVKDVRIIVEKLPSNYSDQNSTSGDESKNPSKISTSNKCNQVARKKTGGMVLKSNLTHDLNNEKLLPQPSGKDGDFVPSVFDKMTRSGRRDLERALAESTANLVIQKTTQLIQEKIRQFQAYDKEMGLDLTEFEEDKESNIQKTAEIVTNTIIGLLSKNKNKKSEKHENETTDDSNTEDTNCENETVNSTISPAPSIQSEPADQSNQLTAENKVDKQLDKEDPNVFRRVTRESTRAITAKKRIPEKKKHSRTKSDAIQDELATLKDDMSKDLLTHLPKINDECFLELEPTSSTKSDVIHEEMATLNDDMSTGLLTYSTKINDECFVRLEQQNMSETCQTKNNKTKGNNFQRKVKIRRNMRSRRKMFSSSKKTKKRSSISKKKINVDLLLDESSGDEEVLIHSKLNKELFGGKIRSDLNESSKQSDIESTNDKSVDTSVMDNRIVKVNADSTTTESLLPNNDVHDLSMNYISANDTESKLFKKPNIRALETSTPNSQVPSPKLDSLLNMEKIPDISEQNNDSSKPTPSVKNDHKSDNSIANRFAKDSNQNLHDSNVAYQDELRKENLSNQNNIAHADLVKRSNENMLCENRLMQTIAEQPEDMASTGLLKETDLTDRVSNLADSTSFLNYTLDDSFKLMIDESTPDKEEIKLGVKHTEDQFTDEKFIKLAKESITSTTVTNPYDINVKEHTANCLNSKANTNSESMDHIHSFDSVPNKDTLRTNQRVANSEQVSLDAAVDNKSGNSKELNEQPTELKNIFSDKPLTNEEKIAQLIKRDPRLGNDKKLANVLRRDPRIRNKLKMEDMMQEKNQSVIQEKVQSEQETALPMQEKSLPVQEKSHSVMQEKALPEILESSISLDPAAVQEKLAPVETSVKEKLANPQSQSELPEADNTESSRKKKCNKKQVDKELLYKTPLSDDLHESNSDRPTYGRGTSRKFKPDMKREREEDFRLHERNRSSEEANDREYFGSASNPETKLSNRNTILEDIDDRRMMFNNVDEDNRRREEHYYGGQSENRGLNLIREQDYQSGSREVFEYPVFHRRQNYNVNDRRDFDDSKRKEYYFHRNDRDNYNSFSRVDQRRENSFHSDEQDSFREPLDSSFRVSGYSPTSGHQLFNPEEDIDQRFRHFGADNFSPPPEQYAQSSFRRSPSPERLRQDIYSPPQSSRGRGIPRSGIGSDRISDEKVYDDNYRSSYYGNYERGDQGSSRGRSHYLSRDRSYGSGGGYRRGNTRGDHRWKEDSPPRKRFASDLAHEKDREGPRWRRSPSWSPERSRRWSPERRPFSPSPERPWNSPVNQRWQENYHERSYYHRY